MILCLIFSVTAVSAVDINETTNQASTGTLMATNIDDNSTGGALNSDGNDVLAAGNSASGSVLGASGETGSLTDLELLIKLSDANIVLYQNYTYDSTVDSVYANGFNITKSIAIDGQGLYTINTGNCQINIQSDSVTLKNLNFYSENFKYLIYSTGNNIVLENCTFKNMVLIKDVTTALIGGKDGSLKINNSKFYNIATTCTGTATNSHYISMLDFNGECIVSNSYFDNTRSMNANHLIVKNSIFKNYDNSRVYAEGLFAMSQASSLEVYDSKFYNICYMLQGTRNNAHFDNISVYDSANTHLVSDRFSIFSPKTYYTVNNSYFEGCSGSIFGGGALVYNTNFTSNTVNNIIRPTAGGGVYDGVVLDNCTFKNNQIDDLVVTSSQNIQNGDLFEFNGIVVSNNIFINNTMRISLTSDSNSIINNTFTNNNGMFNQFVYAGIRSQKIGNRYQYANSDKSVIINNTFTNNKGFNNAPIWINTGSSYISGNVFFNNTNNAGNSSSTIYNPVGTSYTPYYRLYASPEGNGSGVNKSDRCNLNFAVNNIMPGGTIYLEQGSYNDVTGRPTLNAHIIGESETGVIINKGSFILKLYNGNIKNIIFNDTQNPFANNVLGTVFDNVTIVNYTKNNVIILNAYNYDYDSGLVFRNITIMDSKISCFETEYTYQVTLDRTFENFNVIRTNFTNTAFVIGSGGGGVKFYNMNFKDCKFDKRVLTMGSSNYGFSGGYIYDVKTVTLNNCSFASSDYIFYNSNVANFAVLDDIHIINTDVERVTRVVGDYKYNVSNFEIKNLSSSFIFYSDSEDFNALNILLENVDTDYLVSGSVPGWSELESLSLINVNMTSLFGSDVSSLSSLKGLIFRNVNFTSGNIIVLYARSSLADCNMENVTGHFIVNGTSVKIMNSNFTGFNNSDLNGGVFAVNSDGDYLIFENVRFVNNTAYYGGAVYVSDDVLRMGFYNTIFRDNVARDLGAKNDSYTTNISSRNTGGAIYFNHTVPGGYVIITMDGVTEDTLNTSSLYYNNMRGNVTTLKADVYVVFDYNNWGTKTGTCLTPESAGDFMKAFALVGDNGRIHFVNESELYNFTELYSQEYFNIRVPADERQMSYNITFYGNKTVLSNLMFWVPEGNVMSVYNMAIVNANDTAIIVDGAGRDGLSGSTFVNCSIVNCGGSDTVYGAGMIVNANYTSLVNVSFINDTAGYISGSFGGGLYINASNVIVDDCTFRGNDAGSGSHIYVVPDKEFISITDSVFDDATQSFGASGVFLNGGTKFSVSDCNFTGNEVTALRINGAYMYLDVMGNNFTNNSAADGAGAYIVATTLQSIPLNINDNVFTGNNASNNGGALVIDSGTDSKVLVLNNNVFTGNNASNNGGALIIYVDGVNVIGSEFTGNNAVNGGAVYVDGADVVLSDCNFTGNNATYGGAAYVNMNGTVFNNCNFTGNIANVTGLSFGSAVYVADNTDVTIKNSYFNRNYVAGEDNDNRADISYDGILPSISSDTILGGDPYQQYAHNRTGVKVWYNMVYVSMTERGIGYSNDTATTMTKALEGILPNGVIIICDDDYKWNMEDLETLTKSNLANVTFQGLSNKTSIKRNNTQYNEYLFNPLKKIKNFSLNNYLSSQSLKNKK